MARTLPNISDLIGYDRAVAGHDGVMSDADGELFIKPCTPAEVAFYESSNAQHPRFAECMPTFLGSLELAAQQNGTATLEQHAAALTAKLAVPDSAAPGLLSSKHSAPDAVAPAVTPPKSRRIATNTAVVLENTAAGFVQPNILDVKLGVRLWADDASQDKKERFDIITEKTTHKNLGFRIAGMRVWQGEGAVVGGDIDKDGYKIYSKDYGRFSVTEENVADSFRQFIFNEGAGIDQELGSLVAQAFIADLSKIQNVMENQESEMYSASLLFVFEGDGKALRAAMEEASQCRPAQINGNANDGEEGDDDDSDDESERLPKIYSVKIIDFAHARWTPGQGPDENSLLGVKCVTKILKDLAKGTDA